VIKPVHRFFRYLLALALVLGLSMAGWAGGVGSDGEIRYEVVASPDANDLLVEMELPPGLDSRLTIDPEAAAFVDDVRSVDVDGKVSEPVPALGNPRATWSPGGCAARPCRVRYHFHLRAAARAIDDPDTAAVRGEALCAPVSTWLLRPAHIDETVPGQAGVQGLQGRLHVVVTWPLTFLTGLPPVPRSDDTYVVTFLPHFVSPYSAFGHFQRERLSVGGADLELGIATPALLPDAPRIRSWVVAAAQAVSLYFGRFPVNRALVLAVPRDRGLHGKEMGGGGASVLIQMQPGSDLGDPRFDWQAAHEMVHLAVPEMSRAQLWLSEGLATYIEPFARLSTGELSSQKVWHDLVVGLPLGLPEPGDRGLDHTHTWGRTYWGGALFAFVADVEIRRATEGRSSLATAIRAVMDAGGDTRVGWTVDRFMSTCDGEVGQPILTTLYHRLRDRPGHVDLDSMWRELGISATPEGIDFDDRAPLARIRRQMSGRGAASASPPARRP
jgi:hypothetical protein